MSFRSIGTLTVISLITWQAANAQTEQRPRTRANAKITC